MLDCLGCVTLGFSVGDFFTCVGAEVGASWVPEEGMVFSLCSAPTLSQVWWGWGGVIPVVVGLDLPYYAFLVLVVGVAVSLTSKLKLGSSLSLAWFSGLAVGSSFSFYEVFGLFTLFTLLNLLSLLAALAEDDLVELSFVFFSFLVVGSIASAATALGLPHLVGFISPTSGGESLKSLVLSDWVNVGLLGVRLVMCVVRFIVYDAQVEQVDMVLQYTEGFYFSLGVGQGGVGSYPFFVCLDLLLLAFKAYITAFKYVMAIFLLALMVDLFLLRTLSLTAESWAF